MTDTTTIQEGWFATCLCCMDGRTIEPILAWAKKRFGVRYVDMITEPGMDSFLCVRSKEEIEEKRKSVFISLEHHTSRVVIVSGHCACAGNPVSKDKHREDIKKCCKKARAWNLPPGVFVFGILVNDSWEVEEIE